MMESTFLWGLTVQTEFLIYTLHLCSTASVAMRWLLIRGCGSGLKRTRLAHQREFKGEVRGHQRAVRWWFTLHNSRGLEASLIQGMHADPNYSKSCRGLMTRRDHTPPPERKTSRSGGVKNLGRWLEGWGRRGKKKKDFRLRVDLDERTGG